MTRKGRGAMEHQTNAANAEAIGKKDDIRENDVRAHLESLIRSDYERCRPNDSLEDLKMRAAFSKEDRGLLSDWMAVAARRAIPHDEAIVRRGNVT